MGTDGDQNIIIKTLINLVTISKKALIVSYKCVLENVHHMHTLTIKYSPSEYLYMSDVFILKGDFQSTTCNDLSIPHICSKPSGKKL